jgi:hypothetical protein
MSGLQVSKITSIQGNRRILELNNIDLRLYESNVNLVAEFTMKDLQK